MEIIFHNESILPEDDTKYSYPFPNCIQFKMKKYSIGFGVLGMTGDTWEEYVMYRIDRMCYCNHNIRYYKQFRFLIFAVAIEYNYKNPRYKIK